MGYRLDKAKQDKVSKLLSDLSELLSEDTPEGTVDIEQFLLDPSENPESWTFYKLQQSVYWNAEEMTFEKNRDEYIKANENTKRAFKIIISFFLVADGEINLEMIMMLIEAWIQKDKCRFFYISAQLGIENTHWETYTKAARSILPEKDLKEAIEMCNSVECIKEKNLWIKKYTDQGNSPALRSVACGAAEGIFFVSIFSTIFYFRTQGIFENFIFANEQISKDETIHRDEKADYARRHLKDEEKDAAVTIIKEAVDVEKRFIDYMLQEPIFTKEIDSSAGFNLKNQYYYIELLADQFAVLCGLSEIYNTSKMDRSEYNLTWLQDMSMIQKGNFYERERIGSYRSFDPEKAAGTKIYRKKTKFYI